MTKSAFKREFKKLDQVRVVAGYHHKGFWTLIMGAVFAAICLIHIETSRAKPADVADNSKVTIERIPASEARHMGVDSRNN